MKIRIKIIFSIAMMCILGSLLCITVFAANGSISSFSIDADSAADSDALGSVDWYKGGDGKYYVFLPQNADTTSMTVWFSADADVYCGSDKLSNGEKTGVFTAGNSYTLTCGDSSYTVVFVSAKGIGTIYINTESGNLNFVHADKENKEPGSTLILDEKGEVQYDGTLEYIKGRGNSTWTTELEKKPYNIKLDSKADLFGMGKSKKWCLLANIGDNSLIRNQVAFDLASNLGIEETSDTTQVNLYINGDYRGVYTVTEKVEIDSKRVDIFDLEKATEEVNSADLDTYAPAGAQNSTKWNTIKYANIPNDPENITGGYLLELEKIYRYPEEVSGFITSRGQAVVVKAPEYASSAQVEYISNYYQQMEDALYSPNGYNSLGKHYSEYIDVDSLAGMYILDEFAENFDGCSSSFYLYKDVDGKLTAGPAWDFDLSFGYPGSNDLINHVASTGDPNMLYIATCYIGNHNTPVYGFLAQACAHDDFMALVKQMWAEKFNPYYDTLLSGAKDYGDMVSTAAVANALRWNTFSTMNTNSIANAYAANVNTVSTFIGARYSFISNVLAPDSYLVKYSAGSNGKTVTNDRTVYKKGDKATVLAAPESTKGSMMFTGWTTNPDGTGDFYLPGDEIDVNGYVHLYAQWEKDTSFKGRIKAILESIVEFYNKIMEAIRNLFSFAS